MNLMLAEREAAPRERLTPLGRLEALCDPGSLELVRTRIASRSARSAPGDGVVAGAGTVSGRPVYCYAQDQGFAGGSLVAAFIQGMMVGALVEWLQSPTGAMWAANSAGSVRSR